MNYSNNRTKKVLWSAVAAVGIGGIAAHALGQTTNGNYALNASYSSEFEASGEYYGQTYTEYYGPSGTYPSYGVYDFATGGGSIPNPAVTAVSPNFTVDLYDEGYSTEDTNPATFSFFLTTDTTTATNSTSPLKYDATSYSTNGQVANGVAAPGSADSFAGSSALYYLGSGTFTPGGAGYDNTFNLSLNNAGSAGNISAAESYLTSETKAGADMRIVVTSNSTYTGYLSALGYESADPPKVTLNVTSSTAPANNSTIFLTSPPAGGGNTANNITVNLGRVINTYGVSQTFAVSNGGSSGSTALVLTDTSGGLDGSSVGSPNPIPTGSGTGTITAGFSSADTAPYQAGITAYGSAVFTDDDHTSSTITVNASAYVVDQRKITAGGTGFNQPAAINAGKILVGATGKATGITLSTTNTNSNLPAGNDEGPDVLTTETLAAGAQSETYPYKDPFTTANVATLSAIAGPSFTFNSTTPDTGGVTGYVAVAVSGIYGDAHSTTINGQTEHFNGQYAGFSDTAGLSNDGTTAGEYDTADVYLQWQGYQAAAVSGNSTPSSPLTVVPNSTATATLTNIASNDNIATVNSVSQSQGLRAGALVTSVVLPTQTWSSGGWSLTGITGGTTISGSQSAGDGTNYTANGTVGFNTSSGHMINGTYGTTLTVNLENEQDIQGAALNDLAPVVFNLQSTVSSNPSVQSGAYTLNGGTLVAGATDLTGSFTQSGGKSTFTKFTGSGQVAISGGSATLAVGGGNSSVGSLSITGAGSLDVTNNQIVLGYTSSSATADSTIRGYLISGRNGGAWNGTTGIITSGTTGSGVDSGYTLGYADGAEGVVAGLTSGQIEVKYTLVGDALLNGSVTGNDFTILIGNLGKSFLPNGNPVGWDDGDFEYTGSVTGNDFTDLVGNLGKTATLGDVQVPGSVWAAVDAYAAANGITLSNDDVPEPASAGLLLVAGVGMLARRRRCS